ncbi:hypothetical protein SAMN05216349_1436 [Oribacterium sp. KHPX15]|uniref:FxLYD domain-containing protein n=1 Tax=Oribacterium sp. KHPX15 TaxID=1855342 RepID=UPI00089B3D9E|nr:FxLYD domain-containing protein [Oribacterium sp. KHPX15]SEA88050.1 hypothetical protein SAMN05216349_1436 [Oribacterium sp. KHPX15]
MKRILTIILSTVMALSVSACGGGAKPAETTTTVANATTETETTGETTEAPAKIELNIPIGEDMTIVEAMYDDTMYTTGDAAVKLKIRNNTETTLEEVGFQFYSYDKNGDRVGSQAFRVSDMEAGHSTWTSNFGTELKPEDLGSVKIEYYTIDEVKDGKHYVGERVYLDPKPEVLFEEMNKKE